MKSRLSKTKIPRRDQKQLIAIPVNRYSEDFWFNNTSDSYSSVIYAYTNQSNKYVGEGYLGKVTFDRL